MCAPRLRNALLLAALLLLPARAQAAVAFVQSGVNTTTPFTGDGIADVTLGANSTIGNLMVVAFSVEASSRSVTSVTAGGATLTLCSDGTQTATLEISTVREIWAYCGVATSATTAVQVTISSACACVGFVAAAEFSGAAFTSSQVEDVAVATNNALGNHDTGNVTTANAGSVLFGFIAGSGGAYNEDADFTSFTGADHGNGVSGYDLVDAGSFSYTPTTDGTEETLQMVIAIAPSGGGGGATGYTQMPLLGVGL